MFLCALYNFVQIESLGNISDTIKIYLTFYQPFVLFYKS